MRRAKKYEGRTVRHKQTVLLVSSHAVCTHSCEEQKTQSREKRSEEEGKKVQSKKSCIQ